MLSGLETVVVRAGALAAELSEAEATRRVLLTAGGLVLLGVALMAGTVLWWRSTRPDPPALAPLEVMGARQWGKAGLTERRRLINDVRPQGSNAMRMRVEPEPLDLDRQVDHHQGFDDLRELDALLGALVGGASNGSAGAAGDVSAEPPGDAVPVDAVPVDAVPVDATMHDATEQERAGAPAGVALIDPLLQRDHKPD